MDESRLFRITLSGGVFVFSILFHYWILGGDFSNFKLECKTNEALIGLIIVIISSPALGFIISTISIKILHLLFNYRIHFLFPTDIKHRQIFYSDLLSLTSSINVKDKLIEIIKKIESEPIPKHLICINSKFKKNLKELYWLFILIIRIYTDENVTNHIVRLWNTFWTHINNITAILFGFFFALGIRIYFDKLPSKNPLDYELSLPFILELPIIIYIISGIWHLINSRNSAIHLENLWLCEIKKKNI